MMIEFKNLARREKTKMIHRFAGCALAFKLDMKNRTIR